MLVWLKSRFLPRLGKALSRFLEDDGNLLAASLAYYMALSFFPLLITLIAGLGLTLRHTGWGQDAQQRLIEFIGNQTSPALAEQVDLLLNHVESQAAFSGPVGLVVLLFTAVTIFAQFDRAFDRIWKINQQFTWGVRELLMDLLIYRFKAFLMLLAVGLMVLVTLLLGIGLSTVAAKTHLLADQPTFWSLVQIAATMGLNILLFTAIYKVLPKAPIRWSEAARGAVLAAVLWEISRQLLALFLGNAYGAYGLVGSFIGILLWVYFVSAILFFAAEYVQIICAECDPLRRPKTVEDEIPEPHG